MDKKRESHSIFLERLCSAAERDLGMNKDDRGFRRALAKALGTRDSTIQRWFSGSYPEAEYLIKLYQKFGVTPNHLFSIDSGDEKTQSLDLHKIKFIVGAKTRNLPAEFLDAESFTIGPILKTHEAATHIHNLTESDIDSWGVTRNDMVLNRKNILAFALLEKVTGTSMYPVLKHGDLVVIDMNDKKLVDDAIYAIRTNSKDVICRQIKKSDNSLILIPWNLRDYKPELLDLSEHEDAIIGRVIFSVSYFAQPQT
jgi:transcriptional regulator with XRE-family HTH domain